MTKKSNLAAEIVTLHDIWTRMTKTEIANNIESQLYARCPDCQNSFNEKMTALMDMTGARKQTVYSWFNHSRLVSTMQRNIFLFTIDSLPKR